MVCVLYLVDVQFLIMYLFLVAFIFLPEPDFLLHSLKSYTRKQSIFAHCFHLFRSGLTTIYVQLQVLCTQQIKKVLCTQQQIKMKRINLEYFAHCCKYFPGKYKIQTNQGYISVSGDFDVLYLWSNLLHAAPHGTPIMVYKIYRQSQLVYWLITSLTQLEVQIY